MARKFVLDEQGNITEGFSLSILLSGAVAHSAVFVNMLHVKVDSVKDKSIKISSGKYSITLPLKALEKVKVEHIVEEETGEIVDTIQSCNLARWFIPKGFQIWFMSHCNEISGQDSSNIHHEVKK